MANRKPPADEEPENLIPFPRPMASPDGGVLVLSARPEIAESAVRGLIRALQGRAPEAFRPALGQVGLRLVQGWPRSVAVIGSGISGNQLKDLCKADSVLHAALQELEDAGFGSSLVAEAYRRAMAGNADRGSARMLEILLKSRDPQFREKYGLELSIVQAAESATNQVVSGWKDVTPPVIEADGWDPHAE